MAEHVSQQDLARIATITDAPVRTKVDRTFSLPTGLYVATVGSYLGFLAVMSAVLMNPELVLPMVAFVISVVGGFALAAKWVRMQPGNESHPLTFDQFRHRGIDTLTGRLTAKEASVQVLILPVLIFAWGITCAVIIALT